ncbi:flagellar hook-associated protein FlgK, partial [Pseudomonas frederiksbergensis]|nr:flagellar hook-associated protein FlgK [Pseudomonas frederiksbergensis]
GTIIPGQENKLQINVPIVDANGNAVTPAATFSFDMTVAGAPKKGDNYTVAMTGAGPADNRHRQAVIALQTTQTIDLGD